MRAIQNHEATSSLYVMMNPLLPHLVKIGQACDVDRRAIDLSSSHPFDMKVCYQYPGQGYLENIVHDRLRAHRFTGDKASRGREWFEVQPHHADGIIRGTIAEWQLTHPEA